MAEKSKYILWTSVAAKVATIVIAIIGMAALYISYQANRTTQKALEIANRPILSLTKPRYTVSRKEMRFDASFELLNSGRTPAHEFEVINDKVLFVSKEKDFSRFKDNQGKLSEEYFFFRKGILELLLHFFEKNPKATLEDVRGHFAELTKNPALVDNKYLKDKANKVAFRVDGYGDVLDWKRPPTMITPNSRNPIRTGRSSGNEVDQLVENGKNMIVVFMALQYEGINPDKKFRYYFLGYYDNPFGERKSIKFPRRLIWFKEWSSRDNA